MAGARTNGVTRLVLLGIVLGGTPSAVVGATPLSYATTWDDGEGTARSVSFQGSVDRGVISGLLRVSGRKLQVKGRVRTDGTMSGAIRRPDGTEAATFWARPDAAGVLRGTVTYAGKVKTWSAPGVVLPGP